MKHLFPSFRGARRAPTLPRSPGLRGFLAITASAALASTAFARLGHEVWLLDQSNTYDSDANGSLDSGGYLYIYQGTAFDGTSVPAPTPEVIDLGGTISAAIKTQTGTAPVRPHYLSFNRAGTHALITFVATGHVLIIEAATRTIVYSVDVGVQAHASNASPDDTYILVANQNGKLVQRIDTDMALAGIFPGSCFAGRTKHPLLHEQLSHRVFAERFRQGSPHRRTALRRGCRPLGNAAPRSTGDYRLLSSDRSRTRRR